MAERIKWTDEMIREKVLEVKDALGLDRMPTCHECNTYFGNYALTNAATRRMRWYDLAEELGLRIKDGDTTFGKQHEWIAADKLKGMGHCVQTMSQNFPYDLLVDGCVKVDVKASRLFRGEDHNFYSFNLEKPFATCDVYLLFTINDDRSVRDVFVVPSIFVMRNKQISMGEHSSKYHRFKNRFDYIRTASNFWRGVS